MQDKYMYVLWWHISAPSMQVFSIKYEYVDMQDSYINMQQENCNQKRI